MSEELRGNDPGQWGHSLANLHEVLVPLLDAAGARSVVEVGAYAGDLTGDLLAWASGAGARVVAVDPEPQPELVELAERDESLELVREPSTEALPKLDRTDAVIVDGDHNYFTVSEELRLIGEWLDGPGGPLVLLHDVCWPHARRDAYYVPDRIPASERQPMAEGGGLVPGEEGIVPGGLPYQWVAEREGGPRNGVLTALEDFVEGRPGLRLAIVPAFFGLGVVWRDDAPWSDAVSAIVGPWDRNPVVARLEANRVHQLVRAERQQPTVDHLTRVNRDKSNLLEGLLASKAFSIGERLARLRHPRRTRSWRDEAKRLVDSDSQL